MTNQTVSVMYDVNEPADRIRVVSTRFEHTVRKTPIRPALSFGGRTLSYRELNVRANRLAHLLRARGIGPEAVVGVLLRRGLDLGVTLLAVAKAGGAFLPIDPDHPAERIRFMLANARARLVVSQRELVDRLPGGFETQVLCLTDTELGRFPATNPPTVTTDDNLLYVVYTSGSTGEPKGIAMPHGPTVDLMDWCRRVYRERQRTLVYYPATSDVFTYELLSTWWCGGSALIASENDRLDVARVATLIRQHQLTNVLLPFVFLDHLARYAEEHRCEFESLTEVVTTGDRLIITPSIRALAARLPDSFVDNQWGSTEVNVVTTLRLAQPAEDWPEIPTIGRPVGSARVYVLDDNLKPTAVNVPGQIYVGGPPLGRGYLGRPDLTARSFLPDPFTRKTGARMYQTGDLGRWRPNGTLEFLGRADFQVKIRGHRVDPGEIESALRERPDVADATVMATGVGAAGAGLVAYVVPTGNAPSGSELRNALRAKLPEHMIPHQVVFLDRMPLTTTGKIDRKRLPAPDLGECGYAAPTDAAQEAIAGVWADVLNLPRVGVHDDFFELGGHSLLVTQVVYRLREIFGVQLPLRALFERPTVAGIAAELQAAEQRERPPGRSRPRTTA